MLKERLISGIIGAILFLIIIFSDALVLTAAVLLVIEIALWEMYRAVGLGSKYALMLLGAFVPVFILFGVLAGDQQKVYMAICIYMAILFAVLVVRHSAYTFEDLAKFFTVTILISLFFSHVVWIRQGGPAGMWNTFAIFVGAWLTDTFAYFTGHACGKHKLAPVISPKKTVEGSIGGIVGTALSMVIYGFIVGRFTSFSPNYAALTALGLACGVISQLGDLSMSAIKREYNIKDYGNIMPGHGGIMDRFDSVLFVAPLVYHFVRLLPIFTVLGVN